MKNNTSHIPKIRFSEFSGEWEEKNLWEVIDFQSGYAFSSLEMSNNIDNFQLIKMSNVYMNQLRLDRSPSYWNRMEWNQKNVLLQKWDNVLTLTWTVWKRDYWYSVQIDKNDKYLLNQRLVRLRQIQNLSSNNFISKILLHERFLYNFFWNSKGWTGNQSNVSIEDLKSLKLPLPQLPEQQKIANFLSSVDEKIENIREKKKNLEEYKKGMMQKIFSQEIRFKDESGESFGEWEDKKLGEVCKHIRNWISSQQTSEKTNSRVTRIETISDWTININKLWYINDLNAKETYILNKWDILFSNINSVKHIWKIAYFDLEETIYHWMNLLCIRVDNKYIISKFLYYVLKLQSSKNRFESICNQAVSQASINQSELSKFHFSLPSLPEQQKIADFLSSLDEKIEKTSEELEKMEEFKKGLLQGMFV